ncbi:MAG: hypothetical protein H6591_04905 [Flavobacteriales bacterium]|nr:hypothetical protein [Flavobacteriales bacterium]
MKVNFSITAHSNVAHPLRRRVVAVSCSLGVPPRKASGSRFPLYSSLVPRCGVPLQSLTRMTHLRRGLCRSPFMTTLRFALTALLMQLSVHSFGQKKDEMTVVFDVTASPDSTMSHLGIEINTDNARENKIRGERKAQTSTGIGEWRSVKMKLSRSAFEGRSVTISAFTDPLECMALYLDTGVVLNDGQHYSIRLVRDEAQWQARKTRASIVLAFPREIGGIDTSLSKMMLRTAEVEVFSTDVETVRADSALVTFDISEDCAVESRRVSVPFAQLRSPLAEQSFELLQDNIRRWNTRCAPMKDVQQWIYLKQR